MLSREENDLLTRVGPGTPAGEMLRRYWHPIAFINELKKRPLRRRLLGEDLVVFRDDRGRLGVLALRCSHRGTSLEFGHLEDGGLRCCYHGWLYDVGGKILEMPGEPADSTFWQRLLATLLIRFKNSAASSSPTLGPSPRRFRPDTTCWCGTTAACANRQLQLFSDDRELRRPKSPEVAAPNGKDPHVG